MLLLKQGYPQEDDIVLCTVQSIQFHSVFVTLDEYGNKRGMIHISEIAPGRIRNIRDYVKEGKKIVCKVLGVNPEKGYIDLSLRRVNEMQHRQKIDEVKKEQLAEKIIEHVSRKLSLQVEKVYAEVSDKVLKKYSSLYECFEEAASGNAQLLGIEERIAKELLENIMQRIKPAEVRITGDLKVSCYLPNGIEVVKQGLLKAANCGAFIRYKGAGTYLFEVVSDDFKKAEKILKQSVEAISAEFKAQKATQVEFIRHEK